MKRVIFIVVLVLSAAVPALAQRVSDESILASGAIRINLGDNGSLGYIDGAFMQNLIGTDAVVGEAGNQVFGAPLSEMGAVIIIDLNDGGSTKDCFVKIASDLTREIGIPQAKQCLDVILDRTRDALTRMIQQQIEAKKQQIAMEEERLAELDAQIEHLQSQMSEVSEKAGGVLSADKIQEVVQQLNDRLRDIEVDLEVSSATRDTLIRRIEEVAAGARDRAETDEILNQLQELLKIKEQSLDNINRLKENGRASVEEYNKVRSDVVQARIEIARRREALSVDGVGDRLAQLNARLDDLLIDSTRHETMYHIVNDQLEQMRARNLPSLAAKYHTLAEQLELVKHHHGERVRVIHLLKNQIGFDSEVRVMVVE